MGYTHYWTQKLAFTAPEWNQITEAFRTLMAQRPATTDTAGGFFSDSPLIITDGEVNPKPEPTINRNRILFNGGNPGEAKASDQNLGHDPMLLKRRPPEDGGDYCKTERKPYDLMVCALLMVAEHVAPDAIEVRSDGRRREWEPAVQFVRAHLGEDISIPRALRTQAELEGRPSILDTMRKYADPGLGLVN